MSIDPDSIDVINLDKRVAHSTAAGWGRIVELAGSRAGSGPLAVCQFGEERVTVHLHEFGEITLH